MKEITTYSSILPENLMDGKPGVPTVHGGGKSYEQFSDLAPHVLQRVNIHNTILFMAMQGITI